jgi:hypothetical protein
MPCIGKTALRFGLVALAALFLCATFAPAANAQAAAQVDLTGRYHGTSRGSTMGELPLNAVLKHVGNDITGTLETEQRQVMVVAGNLSGDKLSLTFDVQGQTGFFSGIYRDGRIEGEWSVATEGGTLSLQAVPAAEAATSQAASGEAISGDWEGTVDVQGMVVGFLLRLKLEGQNLTGEIVSDMGTSSLQSPKWEDGRLRGWFALASGESVSIDAALQGDRLTGSFDAGMMQLGWSAKKR